jgi:hypothetical protein
MKESILDKYTSFLISTNGQASATACSRIYDETISHDEITRFLANANFNNKVLWLKVKSIVQEHQRIKNVKIYLAIDDTYVEKAYMEKNDLICTHYDHAKGRYITGVNIVTLFFIAVDEDDNTLIEIPIGVHLVEKTEAYEEDGKVKYKSPKTKNEIMQDLIYTQAIQNRIKMDYVLADCWFCTQGDIEFFKRRRIKFIMSIPEDRLAAETQQDARQGNFCHLSQMDIKVRTPSKIYLKGLPTYELLITKENFYNKDDSIGTRYLVTNDRLAESKDIKCTFSKRWSIEEFHKSVKQNCSIGGCPARRVKNQSNHMFAAVFAYIKLEKFKAFCSKFNHFYVKAKLREVADKAALEEFNMFSKFLVFA